VENLGRDDLTRHENGHAGRIGRDHLGARAPGGGAGRDGLVGEKNASRGVPGMVNGTG
jgi:hypothetical protein